MQLQVFAHKHYQHYSIASCHRQFYLYLQQNRDHLPLAYIACLGATLLYCGRKKMDWEQTRKRKLFNNTVDRTPHVKPPHLHLQSETTDPLLTAQWEQHERRYSYVFAAVWYGGKKHFSWTKQYRQLGHFYSKAACCLLGLFFYLHAAICMGWCCSVAC